MAETKDKSIRRTGWLKLCYGKSILSYSFLLQKIKLKYFHWKCEEESHGRTEGGKDAGNVNIGRNGRNAVRTLISTSVSR
jgi:hypothetical protein